MKKIIIIIVLTSLNLLISLTNAAEKHKIIGKWFDAPIQATVEIYKDDGKLYIYRQFKDGGKLKQELVKEKSKGKIIYRKVDSATGDYYIINKENGYLEMYDSQGFIDNAKAIK